MIKSTEPVYCRACGKAIRKFTSPVYVHDRKPEPYDNSGSWCRHVYPDPIPMSLNDCRALTNQIPVSISRDTKGRVASFNEWDGETYADRFFCSNTCAIRAGRSAAEDGWASGAWLNKRSTRRK